MLYIEDKIELKCQGFEAKQIEFGPNNDNQTKLSIIKAYSTLCAISFRILFKISSSAGQKS